MQIFGGSYVVAKGLSLLTQDLIKVFSLPESIQDVYLPAEGSSGFQKRLSAKIYSFDAKTISEWNELQQKRLQSGQPVLNLVSLTREVESISNDSRLTDQEKKDKIDEVRKRAGLSTDDMKKFVTGRLEKIYDESKVELEKTVQKFREDVSSAETTYGKESPQALQAAHRLNAVTQVAQPLIQQIDNRKNLYASMYASGKGNCIKKMVGGIGNMLKGIAKTAVNFVTGIVNPKNWLKPSFWTNVVAPMALHFIPGIGTVAAVAYRWGKLIYRGVKTVQSLAQGQWDELVNFGKSLPWKKVFQPWNYFDHN